MNRTGFRLLPPEGGSHMGPVVHRVASALHVASALGVASAFRRKLPIAAVALVIAGTVTFAQGTVTPADLLQPSAGSWPMYNGDYSGRRFSPLTKIDASTVGSMTLAWVYRPNPGNTPAG